MDMVFRVEILTTSVGVAPGREQQRAMRAGYVELFGRGYLLRLSAPHYRERVTGNYGGEYGRGVPEDQTGKFSTECSVRRE